ncbi:MAG: response regulator [Candidatus Lindowbacteria bacterium]|nr:response regulator [Candidatus Lindowbacteria bacterium]
MKSDTVSSHTDLHSILDAMSLGILITDEAGKILVSNAQGIEIFGEEIDSKLVQDILGTSAPDDILQIVSKPNVADIVININRKFLSLSGRTTKNDGKVQFVFTLTPYGEKTRQLEKVLTSERQAAIGRLMSGIAHELNNALTGILATGESLLMESHSEETKQSIATMHSEAQRAAHIISDLLTFGRASKATLEAIGLNGLIRKASKIVRNDLIIRNILLETTPEHDVALVSGDHHQILQVIINLIINARDEAGEGGRIRVSTHSTSNYVNLIVEDNGEGVPEDVRDKIFDPFFTTKQIGSGAGLGLSVSCSIISAHGGSIRIDTSELGGAKFIVSIPKAKGTETPTTSIRPSPPHNLNILLLDDEEVIRRSVANILRKFGNNVKEVAMGQLALAHLEKNNTDLIITDIAMPGMDGINFIKNAENFFRDNTPPILIMTGKIKEEIPELSNVILRKPFSTENLWYAIQEALKRK